MKLWQRFTLLFATAAGLFALACCAKLPQEEQKPQETTFSSPSSITTAPPYTPAAITADTFALYCDEMPRGIFRNTAESPKVVEQALNLYQNAALFPVTEPESGKNLWIHMAFAKEKTDVACLSVSGSGHVLLTEGRQSTWYFGGIPLYDALRALFLQEQYAAQPFAPGFLQAEVHAFDKIQNRPEAKLDSLTLSASFPVTNEHSFHLFTATLSVLQDSKNRLPTAAFRREETFFLPYLHHSQSDRFTLLPDDYLPDEAALFQAKAAFSAAFFQDARYAPLYTRTDPLLWLISLWQESTVFGFASESGEIQREMPPVAALFPADIPAFSWQNIEEDETEPIEQGVTGLFLAAADASRTLTVFPGNRILLHVGPGNAATQGVWLRGVHVEGEEALFMDLYDALRLAAFGETDRADLSPAFFPNGEENPLDLAIAYMAFWSAHLESLPLGHLYAATDFALIGQPVVDENATVPGEKTAFSATFAVRFAGGAGFLPAQTLWPENTAMGEGDLEGFLVMRRFITLTLGENGLWQADLLSLTDG